MLYQQALLLLWGTQIRALMQYDVSTIITTTVGDTN